MNYYCDNCKTVWNTIAKSKKGLEACPDCSGELIKTKHTATDNVVDKTAVKDMFRSKFTDKERKSIFSDYKKWLMSLTSSQKSL